MAAGCFLQNLEFSVVFPETGTQFPTTVHLLDNYPNPFNPSTTIVYDISTNGSGHHSIAIFNILGEAIREWQFANDAPRIRREIGGMRPMLPAIPFPAAFICCKFVPPTRCKP